MEELTSLLNRTLEYYRKIQDRQYVVKPAIPILYFGDVNAYFKSNRTKPYVIHQYEFSLNRGKVSKVYFGQAAEKPFGTLSNNVKHKLGKKILAEY